MGQISSYRFAIAQRYWNAANLVVENQSSTFEHMEPVGYLLAMAAEVSLKTFLADRGWTDKQLSNTLRHDLRKCLREAIKSGLLASDIEVSCILNMREAHMSHFNRYGVPAKDGSLQFGAVLLTDEEVALECVGALLQRLSGSPNRSALRHPGRQAVSWPHTLSASPPVSEKRFEEIEQLIEAKLRGVQAINLKFHR